MHLFELCLCHAVMWLIICLLHTFCFNRQLLLINTM